MAAGKMGLKECPVDYQDFKSKAEEMAVLVADNVIGEFSETDVTKMSDIIATLEKAGYDLELTGFSLDEIAGMEIPKNNKPIDEDAMKDTQNECPKCGFVW